MPKRTAKRSKRRRARRTGFVPVQIVTAPIEGLTIITPSGIRVEGLSIEQVIAYLAAVER